MKILYIFFISFFLFISAAVVYFIPPEWGSSTPWQYPQIWLAIVTLSTWIGAFYVPEAAGNRPAELQRNLSVQKSIVFTAFTLTAFIIFLFL